MEEKPSSFYPQSAATGERQNYKDPSKGVKKKKVPTFVGILLFLLIDLGIPVFLFFILARQM